MPLASAARGTSPATGATVLPWRRSSAPIAPQAPGAWRARWQGRQEFVSASASPRPRCRRQPGRGAARFERSTSASRGDHAQPLELFRIGAAERFRVARGHVVAVGDHCVASPGRRPALGAQSAAYSQALDLRQAERFEDADVHPAGRTHTIWWRALPTRRTRGGCCAAPRRRSGCPRGRCWCSHRARRSCDSRSSGRSVDDAAAQKGIQAIWVSQISAEMTPKIAGSASSRTPDSACGVYTLRSSQSSRRAVSVALQRLAVVRLLDIEKDAAPENPVDAVDLRAMRIVRVSTFAWCLRWMAAHSLVTMPVVSQSQKRKKCAHDGMQVQRAMRLAAVEIDGDRRDCHVGHRERGDDVPHQGRSASRKRASVRVVPSWVVGKRRPFYANADPLAPSR